MKSVFTLIIAVFLVAVLPHALAKNQLVKRSDALLVVEKALTH